MSELVSIVLPVYNGEKYLKKSIDSIINQTYTNWELLILDDCSTDSTPLISNEYVKIDSRIKYYKNDINLRLPKNLNRGFSLSKGNYLTWTSDDNIYLPNAIEKMVNKLKKDQTDFTFASCRIIDAEDKPIEYIMVNKNSPTCIVGHNCVGACFMYTRKVYDTIGDYNPEYTLVEDYDYWQRIFQKFNVSPIEEILYLYRMHDGALTSTMKKTTFNHTLEKMLLKNYSGFKNVSLLQKYFFYRGLYNCRKNINEDTTPYKNKYHFYSIFYLLQIRIPNKIKRILKFQG
ncbi:MAG: glycosyltransferase family 2 protein [Clostridia bacterium]|nr:glycosyltransferase family 2 protein [Clostridia bacterium]